VTCFHDLQLLLCASWIASYVVVDSVPALRASLMALVLTAVHVGSAVLIALFAGFLVSRTFTSAGQAPLPEMASRWATSQCRAMAVTSCHQRPLHLRGEGFCVAIFAGLVPCPLTLFVMLLELAQAPPGMGLSDCT
jgi:ABC-type nickel/cobalt efflux system permease component RcnA